MPIPEWARDRDPQQYRSKHAESVAPQSRTKCVYTGSVVVGIALLPKQAYTPVTRTDDGKTDPKGRHQ